MSTAPFLQSFFPRVSTSTSSSSPSPSDPPAWDGLLTPPREGESIRALHARCTTLLAELIPALEAQGCKKLVLFSHAATVIALSRAFAGDLPEELLEDGKVGEKGKVEQLGEWKDEERLQVQAATCSVGKFTRVGAGAAEGGGVKWKREWNGRTDFLEKGEERNWQFSFVGSSHILSLPSSLSLSLANLTYSPDARAEEIAEDGILDDGTEITPLKSDNYKENPTAAPKESEESEGRTKEAAGKL
jgi:hypothetical protein